MDHLGLYLPENVRQLNLGEEVFVQWRQLGQEQGLKSDTQIAGFLLQLFLSSKTANPTLSPALCILCNAPLPSICPRCNTTTTQRADTAAMDTAAMPLAEVTKQEDGRQDTVMLVATTQTVAADEEVCMPNESACTIPTTQNGRKRARSRSCKRSGTRPSFLQARGISRRGRKSDAVSHLQSKATRAGKDVDPHKMAADKLADETERTASLLEEKPSRKRKAKKSEACMKSPDEQQDEEEEMEDGDEAGEGAAAADDYDSQLSAIFGYDKKDPLRRPAKSENEKSASEGVERNKVMCQVCGGIYASKGSLKFHLRAHNDVRPYKCPDCPKAFNYSSHLSRHRRVHSGERPYLCTQCGATFTQKNDLNQHMHRHSGLKPYMCSVCAKSCSTAGDLRIHMVSHSDKRPFRCGQCGVCFARESSRIKHMRTHTGEKPFKCRDCGIAYSDSSTLRRHRQRRHEEGPAQKMAHS